MAPTKPVLLKNNPRHLYKASQLRGFFLLPTARGMGHSRSREVQQRETTPLA